MNRIELNATAERCAANARRLGSCALSLSLVLEYAQPIAGRTWTPICAWCIMTADPREEAPVIRLATDITTGARGLDCTRCAYSGPDTLVAAVLA